MRDEQADEGVSADEAGKAADERDRDADERERALDAREGRSAAGEANRAERLNESVNLLSDADERDKLADRRDTAATKRDMAANLSSWLHRDDVDGKAVAGRDAAARDREDARADRISSAIDRSLLTDDDDPRDGEVPDES